ncbi:DUF2267 domain-containing protein [Streptomyces sp. KR80]|uniref:DUF2267 domain-containing protein n=1 Tax=Streptomyces sp. KR80 TaxID=3457426 RepID=UPI003FD0BF62
MSYDQFLARVCDRGGYASVVQAELVISAVLEVLASRLCSRVAQGLAAELPAVLAEVFESRREGEAESFGVEEFYRRVGERTGSKATAGWDVSAVLTSLAEMIHADQLEKILSQLPSGYAPLFGEPE